MKKLQFRLSSLLLLATLVAICVGFYLGAYRPGDISIRSTDGNVVLSEDDIVSVDWKTQTYELTNSGMAKLTQLRTGLSSPYEFCIDDDVVYTGNVTTPLSSFSLEGPVISVFPRTGTRNTITIDWGYPSSASPDRQDDPRFRHRIYTSLWLSGKLANDG